MNGNGWNMRIGEEVYCSCCEKVLPISKFLKKPNSKTSVYPLCKSCYNAKYAAYKDKTNSDAAVWCLLAELGAPYYRDIWVKIDTTIKSTKYMDKIGAYLKLAQDFEKPLDGIWQSDTALESLIDMPVSETSEEVKGNYAAEQETLWGMDSNGSNYDKADYDFLNGLYNDYTQDIVNIDTAQTMRYRDLCKAELRKHKGDVGKETTEEILKLMKLLKLDNFQENKQSDTEKFIDRWAWRIENEEPAECEDLNKYKDYAGNEKMWADILRVVRNAISGSKEYPTIESLSKG